MRNDKGDKTADMGIKENQIIQRIYIVLKLKCLFFI